MRLMAEKLKNGGWRKLLTIITLIALILLIIFLHKDIAETLKNLKKVNLLILSLLIPLEFLNYHAQAKSYETSFTVLKKKLKYWFLFRFSLELNFISTIFPSGGLSGFSYITLRLKSQGVTTPQATLIQLLKTGLLYTSFLLILIVGLIILALSGRANSFLILVSSSLVTLLVVLSLGGLYIISSKKRINSFFTSLSKFLNRIIRVFRPNHRETINIASVERNFTELHESYLLFRHDFWALKWPFIWALIANITEVGAVYLVYVAFGHWVNPGAVIIAYALASFAGLLSILPAGVGVYEALMVSVLAAAGIPASLAIPVTIMYRIVNTLIQIIPGYIFYQKALTPDTSKIDG